MRRQSRRRQIRSPSASSSLAGHAVRVEDLGVILAANALNVARSAVMPVVESLYVRRGGIVEIEESNLGSVDLSPRVGLR